MGVWYCTREDVKSALDLKESARSNSAVDRAIESGSRSVEGLLRRRFYPQVGTRYFDWPSYQRALPWRLWLDENEIISLTSLTAGGTSIPTGNVNLEPVNTGPPFTRLEINLGSGSTFLSGSTYQRALAVAGVFGYSADEEPAGALAAAISSTTATTADVTDSYAIGVGTIVKVDSERMLVTEKTMLTTGQTLQSGLSTAAMSDVTANVTTGSAYVVGETLLLDSERVLVVDIAGNALTVKRAWDGSVLATHSGSTIFAPRRLTVTRGALGTTAATHSNGAPVTRHVVPGLVRELGVAESINSLEQEQSGYARVVGEGDHAIEVRGQGLQSLRSDAVARYGRRARSRAV